MSDFIFSSSLLPAGELSAPLADIYLDRDVTAREFRGSWGTLAVTPSMYPGYQPLETERYICVVLGGPVLYFCANDFITCHDSSAGTLRVLERWLSGQATWSDDLSGPFVVLVIDKMTAKVECITDMMMFIPIYRRECRGEVCIGSHIDALAISCGENNLLDEVSVADFILHHVVTYPFTNYQNIRQCSPASVHGWTKLDGDSGEWIGSAKCYWLPSEDNHFGTLTEAAEYLRAGVQGYIDRLTAPLECVAQFISGGEDSRVLAGLLPGSISRDAYIFLDGMNREGRVAKKVAEAYGASFNVGYRAKSHLLDMLPAASKLVGSGHQFTHAHALGFVEKFNLDKYDAVIGGFSSDVLLKGYYAKKILGSRWPFLPQIASSAEDKSSAVESELFSLDVLHELTRRRRAHFAAVKSLRPQTANEWFVLWPAAMRMAMPNVYASRRLFASHEVFMSKECVRIAASVPTAWKLNRRLFRRAFKPALAKARHIFHPDGRLSYYPWWLSSIGQAPTVTYQKVLRRAGLQTQNHGPWSDRTRLVASRSWAESVARFTGGPLPPVLSSALSNGALKMLSVPSKINILQACYLYGARASLADS